MARKIAAAVFSLGCIHPSTSMALGLGELSLESFLNEPLKANVDLLDTAGLNEDQVKIRLATKEDFQRLGVDRAYFLTGISFEVIIDGKGQGKILITSEDPVLEPYLDFIVEARWPAGRLLREYTVLVDPPVFDASTTVISASETVAAMEGGPPPGQRAGDGGTRGGSTSTSGRTGASGSLAPGGSYLISRNDTLWEIASAAKPEGATVYQTMLDIQRLNPDAFIDGNINQIKAGYLIYLPSSNDISAADEVAVIEEIRQQNDAWRDNRAAAVEDVEAGPSLRISASPEEELADAGAAGLDDAAVERTVAAATAAIQEDLEKSELERADAEQRLLAVTEQLATLEQIVTVKDDQIAALQAALAEAGVASAAADDKANPAVDDEETSTAVAVPTTSEASAASRAAETSTVKPAPRVPEPEDGLPGWVGYLVGGLAVVGGGTWWLRRRREEETDEDDFTGGDVFADVELQQEQLEIEEDQDQAREMPARAEPRPQVEAVGEIDQKEKVAGPESDDKDTRGYGERKHDEYASDPDSGDALAEADIYVAYGRYPQAIELLENAVRSEPDNPTFRLKLVSLFAELGDRERAEEQLYQLRAFGSADNLEQAEKILANMGSANVTRIHPAPEMAGKGDDLSREVESLGLDLDEFESDSPLDTDATILPNLVVDNNARLEPDFAGLEIEEGSGGLADDLDLSIDFERKDAVADGDDEELVFAAEGSEMSTKLDLARAYMDMGDEEGAKQILEEVATEGSDDQREEARLLLQRVG
jgi:pilus assembly protein FimV